MAQILLSDFQAALLARIKSIVPATVPVGHMFFRDFAKYPAGFVKYGIRNFGQAPFTSDLTQTNVTINKPIVQLDVCAANLDSAYTIYELLKTNLNAYAGPLDTAATPVANIKVAYLSLTLLDETYDDPSRFYQLTSDAVFELNS